MHNITEQENDNYRHSNDKRVTRHQKYNSYNRQNLIKKIKHFNQTLPCIYSTTFSIIWLN